MNIIIFLLGGNSTSIFSMNDKSCMIGKVNSSLLKVVSKFGYTLNKEHDAHFVKQVNRNIRKSNICIERNAYHFHLLIPEEPCRFLFLLCHLFERVFVSVETVS